MNSSQESSNEMQMTDEPPERTYPYFKAVPKTLKDNLLYRKQIRIRAVEDEDYRNRLLKMCEQDSLFWLTSFCFLFEPRPSPKTLPFIPWTHQVPVWSEMERYLGYCDVGLEKSRGEGASWMACMLLLHKWLFQPMFAAGLVSKDEASVDSPSNPDSLFWKLDWQLKKLPPWMVPEFKRILNDHTLTNQVNGATIVGFAAGPNVASGGRKTVFVMDELAKFPREGKPPADQACMDSTQHVTDSRFLISTPWGPQGAYYKAMHEESNIKKVKLHWSQNPVRREGGYVVHITKDNERSIQLIDQDYWIRRAWRAGFRSKTKAELKDMQKRIRDESTRNPFKYNFMLTGEYVKHGQLRSPWYDLQCRRAGATPKGIAQELDLDYGGSSSRFFNITLLERLQREVCTPPFVRGEMIYERLADNHNQLKKSSFKRMDTGRLRIWFEPDMYGRVPSSRNYVIACDIGAGTGGVKSSNSSLCVLDRDSGRQMAEFTIPDMLPTDFADFSVVLCYWFAGNAGPALLGWEANGPPGAQFTRRIIQLDYPNCYYRGQSTEQWTERETKNLGWWSNNKTKAALLGEFSRALDTGELEILSHETIEECKFYMNMAGGKIEHIAAAHEEDPTGAGERHGDRVIGASLAWWLAKDYGNNQSEALKDPPPNTFAWRQRERAKEMRKEVILAWNPKSARRRLALGRPPKLTSRERF